MKKIIGLLIMSLVFVSGFAIARGLVVKSNAGPDDPMLYLSLGDLLLKNNMREHALTAYNKAYELNPENVAVLNNLGYYYKDINPLLAEDYFLRALRIEPEYETARNNLALLYNQIDQYDKAAEQLKLLAEKTSKIQYEYDLAINLAKKFYYQGRSYNDLTESIRHFKAAYEEDPSYEHSLENIKVLEEIRREITG